MSERILLFLTAVAFLAALLFAAFWSDTMNEPQFFVVRLIAALAAAGFAVLLPGFLDLQFSVRREMMIRAGGAIAVFVLVWYINPPPLNGTPDNGGGRQPNDEPSHMGFLGYLHDHIVGQVSAETFVLAFASGHEEQLKDLYIAQNVTGSTYGEVLQKICTAYPCLNCNPTPSIQTVKVTLSVGKGPLVATSDSGDLERRKLGCP